MARTRQLPGSSAVHADDRRASLALAPLRVPLLLLLLGLLACGPNQRTVALQQLHADSPRERAAAARKLGQLGTPEDDELWVALERLTRDRVASVRIAAAEALAGAPKSDMREPDQRGALADDALSAELSDLDETVRIAAARVLGGRCNPRAIAYLHGAFSRGGPAVRAEVAAALARCGVGTEQLLAHAEEVRRLHALEKLGSNVPSWRAGAARELGLLGRADDIAKILPLLDSRDGSVAAAAAEGLGLAAAQSAAPALQKLAGDEVPLVASAAIEALAELGPDALAGAVPALVRQAQSGAAQALPAAAALLMLHDEPAGKGGQRDALCAAAREARLVAAAALLARGCPLAPLGEALAAVMKGASPPLSPELGARAAALLEALAQAGPPPAGAASGKMVGTPPISDKAAAALGALASYGSVELAVRAAQVAQRLGAKEAGPQLVAVATREKVALDAARAARKPAEEARAEVAKEAALVAARAPAPDKDKLARLMAMVRARQGRGAARPDAAARLQQLLAGAPGELVSGHPLLAASLSAALALDARGAKELAALLRDDPDPGVAAAARAETATVEMKAPAAPGDCFAAAAAARADGLDAGAPLDESPSELDLRRAEFQTAVLRAPSRAARPGCLAAQLASGADDRPSNVILDAARATLWSDDGDERVAACLLLARAGDSESAPLRRAFTHDPERRVRDACSRPSETASPVTR